MKNNCFNYKRLNVGFLVLLAILLYSCGQRIIPQEMVGHWQTDKSKITVRTRDENRKFEFTSDTGIIVLIINSDYTADGFIGLAKFEDVKIKNHWLLPTKMTGIAFTIECGQIGRIFENDPIDSKEVQLWLSPIKENIRGELRYTEGASHFPMAGFTLTKEND